MFLRQQTSAGQRAGFGDLRRASIRNFCSAIISILKLNDERDVQGLTTSAGIWMTAAIGVAVGLGSLGLAILAAVLTFIILRLALPIENRINKKLEMEAENKKSGI